MSNNPLLDRKFLEMLVGDPEANLRKIRRDLFYREINAWRNDMWWGYLTRREKWGIQNSTFIALEWGIMRCRCVLSLLRAVHKKWNASRAAQPVEPPPDEKKEPQRFDDFTLEAIWTNVFVPAAKARGRRSPFGRIQYQESSSARISGIW